MRREEGGEEEDMIMNGKERAGIEMKSERKKKKGEKFLKSAEARAQQQHDNSMQMHQISAITWERSAIVQ